MHVHNVRSTLTFPFIHAEMEGFPSCYTVLGFFILLRKKISSNDLTVHGTEMKYAILGVGIKYHYYNKVYQ